MKFLIVKSLIETIQFFRDEIETIKKILLLYNNKKIFNGKIIV